MSLHFDGRTGARVLAQRFQQLDRLLSEARHWWQYQPYHHLDLAFAKAAPALAERLNALSLAEIEWLDGDMPALCELLAPWIPQGSALHALSALPTLTAEPIPCERTMAMYMPGRKQAQIEAFTACLPAHRGPYLEWCAGKGHLGRLVSLHRQAEVLSLELQAPLCEEGRQLAARDGARMAFVCADAFADETSLLIAPAHHAMALHACGELHTHLIEQVAARGAEGVTLSPCCYHLIRTSHYRPLSGPAKASVLRLAKSDLKLPLQETVTGGARIARLREQEVAWRLAFDCLQRQVRGVDEYLPVPNMQKSLLTGTFEDFCGWAAERKGLVLPAGLDYAGFLAKGEARYGDVARMELVRHLFRRPLELWLVLDRALFLQEQGYRVEVGEFCDKPMTPRNILIRAVRTRHG
ncbi:methyltransferase [Aeromonas hydrophila]|uniref:methyltransferase n=1 Tax=Aeromonas hydrophila TaxID=644 RepID=UPI00209F1C6D|nr:methyltransferase [Aeromonas hydrophila]MCP1267224.1 SAM-dependent methyltransferase [Aeromonas hydrophila]MCP1296313.1 SAM-dependent methyltransferase [Aeromonas hydrophila]